MSARLAGFALGALLWSASTVALAEPMDLAIERLVSNPAACLSNDGLGRYVARPLASGGAFCQPDNRAFKRLVNQLGFALAPTAMHAASSTGFGGFNFALEATYTKISSAADYWKRGTEGSVDPATHAASIENQSPDAFLSQYSVKVRKGFGFGLEIAGVVGFVPKTSLVNGGVDLRLSLLEGFRKGVLGMLPDIAVGSGVRTMTGTPELQLTTVGVDVQISKPLPIRDSSVLTPWIGYQFLWIFGDSGPVDLTPGTDAAGYCNYAGNNVPGTPDPSKTYIDPVSHATRNVYDGEPVCRAGGSSSDFNNTAVFNAVRLHRQRASVGLNYRYEMLLVGAQWIADLLNSSAANSGANKSDLKGEARQWTLAFDVGAVF
jgi:hypothetical protein